jgi:hypothetical protein
LSTFRPQAGRKSLGIFISPFIAILSPIKTILSEVYGISSLIILISSEVKHILSEVIAISSEEKGINSLFDFLLRNKRRTVDFAGLKTG